MTDPTPQPGDPGFLDWIRAHSGLSIDREATFLYRGAPVEHPRVVVLFKQGLSRADDGRVRLSVGRTWCWVDADGPLFLCRRALCDADGERLRACALRLDDDSETPLVLRDDALALDAEGVLHVRVKDGREWARCLPEAQAALGRFVVEHEDGFALDTTTRPIRIAGPDALPWNARV